MFWVSGDFCGDLAKFDIEFSGPQAALQKTDIFLLWKSLPGLRKNSENSLSEPSSPCQMQVKAVA